MKRSLRVGDEVECLDSVNMANVLMLLSRSGQEIDVVTTTQRPRSPPRVFECKTCNWQFPSFQALGGHQASHKKPRIADGAGHSVHAQAELANRRVYECSICGLEFAIGQALGGHMRRHRGALTEGLSAAHGHGLGHEIGESTKKHVDGKRSEWLDLDLNMPPEKEEAASARTGECRHKIFGFEFADKIPMVDWLH